MPDLASVQPDAQGRVHLQAGKVYTTNTTRRLKGRGEIVVDGTGARPKIDGGGLPKFGAIFRLEKGDDWKIPAVDYVVPKSRFAIQVIGGAVNADGDTATGDRRSQISGGGYLFNAQQAAKCIIRNYNYVGAPEEYVGFAGDPMQRSNPSWNMDGRCQKTLIENITAVAHRQGTPTPAEARFRFMLCEGKIAALEGDVTANFNPTNKDQHKQCFQFRGTGGTGERCKFAGSVIYGPLKPAEQTLEYQAVAASIPQAFFYHQNFQGTGYVMAERGVKAVLVGWRITGVDPRVPAKAECFSAGSGAELVLVDCDVTGFTNFKNGNVIVGAGCSHNGQAVPPTPNWQDRMTDPMNRASAFVT